MKALDTPILLALLEGRREAIDLADSLAGEEVCTTEANLFELECVARDAGGAQRTRRLAALDRLRHKMTVLPIDDRAVHAASALVGGRKDPVPPLVALTLGVLASCGVSEVFTTEGGHLESAGGAVKVTHVRRKTTKSRK